MSAEQTKNMVFEPTRPDVDIKDVLGSGIITALTVYPGFVEAFFSEANNRITVSMKLEENSGYTMDIALKSVAGYLKNQARGGTVRSGLREVK